MAGTQSDKGRRDFLKRTAGICAVTAERVLAPSFLRGEWTGVARSTKEELSVTGLRELHSTMSGYIERGEVPGLVTLIRRGEQTSVDALGVRSVGAEGKPAVQRDTIFRIASMTKAVTAVATMMLVEGGKLRLDEPVDRLMPELANRRVLKAPGGPLDETVPAKRAITVRDLLTFQFGLGFLLDPPQAPILKKMYELQVGITPFPAQMPLRPDEWMKQLGSLPLAYQPGDCWLYHTGSDVLSVLIARASGKTLENFFRERIFEPLEMKDTSFSVPPEKLGRFGSCYGKNPATMKVDVIDSASGQWSKPPVFASGAGGLASTVDDYCSFARMLLARGMHEKTRLLSETSVDMMTRNYLTPRQRGMGNPILGERMGWGFGMSVLVEPDALASTPGRYGWSGGLGSSWWNDPNEGLIAIILTNRAFESADPPPVIKDFWKGAYKVAGN